MWTGFPVRELRRTEKLWKAPQLSDSWSIRWENQLSAQAMLEMWNFVALESIRQ